MKIQAEKWTPAKQDQQPEIVAKIRAAVDEARPHLIRGTREDLAVVRGIAGRIVDLREQLPYLSELRGPLYYMLPTMRFWRSKSGVRNIWSWLEQSLALEAAREAEELENDRQALDAKRQQTADLGDRR